MSSSKPTDFHPTKILQRAYEKGIRAITGRVLLAKKPEQTFSQWLTELARRSQEPEVFAASELLASRMIFHVNATNQRTWRAAAAKSSQSRLLHSLLLKEMEGATGARVQQLIRENAQLIRSVPIDAASTMVDEITKAQQSGARASTMAQMYRTRFPELLKSRTNLIARTETAKASTALTQARCERLAIDWYQWETSKDQRTRKSHKAMHEVLVPWASAPSPELLVGEKSTLGRYNAGEAPNCRCTIIPILTLDDVHFPARVYWQGSIRTFTKPQFKQIAVGLEERTVA